MNRLKKIIAAIISLAVWGSFSITANASVQSISVDFDCVDDYGSNIEQVIPAGKTVIATFNNCGGPGATLEQTSGAVVAKFNSNTPLGDGVVIETTNDPFTVTLRGETELTLIGNTILFSVGGKVPNPGSKLMFTIYETIPASPDQFTIGNPGGEEEINLADKRFCQLAEGNHIYSVNNLVVKKKGKFVFRVVGQNPENVFVNLGAFYHPISDPFIAIYKGFDPSEPTRNLVACNDDIGDLSFKGQSLDDFAGVYTPAGVLLSSSWPYVKTKLKKGNYQLVYMTYTPEETDLWEIGESPSSPYPDWAAGDSEIVTEVWGKRNSMRISGCIASVRVEPTPSVC